MIAGPATSHLLPSQRALLERFRYLTEYGDHLLLLHGAEGVGKTVLAQSLLESAETFNQAYVCVEPRMDPAQLRERIVRQWRPGAVFDPHEPLLDTLERVMPESPNRLMLIVDDAHRMADTLLAEVIALMMEQEALGLRLTLVLVSPEQLVNRLQEQLPEAYQHRLIPVEVPPLSVRERRKLYDQLVRRYTGKLFINQNAVDRQLADQDGSAQAVVALVEAAKSRPPLKEALPNQRWALAFVGAVVLAALLWSLWPAAPVEVATEEPTQAPSEPVDLPRLAETSEDSEATGFANEAGVSIELEQDLGLAKPWSERETPSDRLSEAARALSEPELMIAAEADEAPLEPASQAIATGELDEVQAGESDALTPIPEPQMDQPEPIEDEPEIAPLPAVELPLSVRPLAERPGGSYLLQLAVFSYPQLIGPFLESHGLKDGVRVYRIEREPQPWFVLVQGGYANKQSAQEAKDALVMSVKRLSPYVKSLETVQKELTEELELAEILGQQR
ncbi:SPOR domain-containing protein [Ferrimonas balearica]|uniref:SPOR domain-containing protein n=1 Tax=Ferrimonas balearica TaxID=44012 RepID=UPI001C99A852|nr:AAA family ATPase [Ferrimonas balearica]MBY5923222.1 AAA family ATPase [Ferrimonas balearica]MBY5997402.1 AAA family ATPase [Ferrimonas balearica]